MITEFGHYALVTTLFVALVQSTVPLIGAARGDTAWMATGKTASVAQFLLIAIAFAILTYSYIVSDFSVVNVAQNSHSDKPLLYKITGVWGNHEGSLLLWILILAVFGLSVSLFGRGLPPTLQARVLAVQGMVSLGFVAFILFTSNPFLRLATPPIEGNGLNPILQDPGLALHPPFLYLGYVGYSVAFAFAIAGLLEGRIDSTWARWVRPWTLVAWSFLTLGNGLGSWWAYYELGWGGWWFWDPVENASFMPWLVGTALLHSVIVVDKRDTLKSWTILLAIVTFSLSLLGTFLVRSGVLTSVHAFASDPARGVFILLLLLVTVGGSLTLYAVRATAVRSEGSFVPISREGSLVLNNLLMSVGAAVVLLGTLYPLFLDVVGGGKVSVGPPYFNWTFLPLMIPMAVVLIAGPFLAWRKAQIRHVMKRLRFPLAASIAAAIVTWIFQPGASIFPPLAMGLGAWVMAGTLAEYSGRIRLFRTSLADSLKRAGRVPVSAYGMTVTHFGVGLLIVGITGASAWSLDSVQAMRIGDTAELGGYSFTLVSVDDTAGPNYMATRGEFLLRRNGEKLGLLYPEKRVYTATRRPTTEAAIKTVFLTDLYAVIADPDENGGWVTRLYYKPFVPVLWVSFLAMALGALVSLGSRRHRVPAPAPQDRDGAGRRVAVASAEA